MRRRLRERGDGGGSVSGACEMPGEERNGGMDKVLLGEVAKGCIASVLSRTTETGMNLRMAWHGIATRSKTDDVE